MAKLSAPVIAWERMSVLDTLDIAEIEAETTEATFLAQRAMSEGISDDEKQQIIDELKRFRSVAYQREFIKKRIGYMKQYVVSIPQDWFVEGFDYAAVDYAETATYEQLRTQKFRELAALIAGANPEAVSGN